MKIRKKINLLIWISTFLSCLIIDLTIKHFTMNINEKFIPGFVSFVFQKNTGAAWSLFSGGTNVLIFITIIAIILIIVYVLFSKTISIFFHVSLGLIVGGALGNLFDRIVFGYVRDFIQLDFINFPVFNIADSFLTIGIICLILHYLIEAFKDLKKSKKEKREK